MPDDNSTPRVTGPASREARGASGQPRKPRARRRLRLRSSIGVRLALLALAIGLPFIVYVGVNAARQVAGARMYAKQRSLAVARTVASRVDDVVADNLTALALVRHGVTPDPAATLANDAFLAKIRDDLPRLVHNVGVFTPDGRNVGALNRGGTVDASIAKRSYFRRVAQGAATVVAGPVATPDDGTPVVVYARPIVGASGNVEGVVTISSDLSQVQQLLALDGAAPPGTVIAIVNADGVVLARSVDSQHWIGRSVLDVGKAREHIARGDGVDETLGADNILRIAGFAQAKRTQWHVFVGMPADAALSAANANAMETLAFGALSLLFGAAVCAWLGARIARPLRQLARDATRLARGNLAHRTAVAGDDETGVLASTLNRLAETVEERTRALEDKTAALLRSTEELAARERFVRLIADGVPARITYIDTHDRLLFGNRRFAQFWGHAGNVVGRSLAEVVSPRAYAQIKPELDASYAGAARRFDLVVDRADGTQYYQVDHVPDVDASSAVQGVVTISQDVTALRRVQQALAESEKRLRSITDNIPALVGYIDRERRYRFNNRYYETWLGRPLAEITGRPVADVLGPRAYANVAANLDRAFNGERVDFDVEVPGSGGARFVRGSYIPDVDASGDVIGVYTSSTDVTPQKEVERQLERLAQKDSLTGLPNRHAYNDAIAAALRRSQRNGTQVALLFLDVDAFKKINDTLGHAAGDDVLREFARRLSASVRSTDFVARLAGDEFVIVLEGIHTREECRFVARKIIAAMHAPFTAGDSAVRVTTSIGIALGQGGATTPEQLLKRADSALYAAKGQGRDTFEIAI